MVRKHRRDPLPLEARVRALKLWLIDEWEPSDVIDDLEGTFGITLARTNHQRPRRFLVRLQQYIQKRLFDSRLSKKERQQLNKLLQQAELISYLEDDNEQ